MDNDLWLVELALYQALCTYLLKRLQSSPDEAFAAIEDFRARLDQAMPKELRTPEHTEHADRILDDLQAKFGTR